MSNITNRQNNKLRPTRQQLCFAAAAALAGASQSALAFTSSNSNNKNANHGGPMPTTSRKLPATAIDDFPTSSVLEDSIQCGGENNDLPELLGLHVSESSIGSNNSNKGPSSFEEEQREFELKLGKAMDTLRTDYPEMLTRNPDFTIYDPNIEVVDPSGVTLHNISNYKASFNFLHAIINLLYCPESSTLTYRLIYDCARKNIRVSWNAELIPRAIYGGGSKPFYVDGISVYEVDRVSGLINQHRVEHLLVDDTPVQAEQGIWQMLKNQALKGGKNGPEGVPVWNLEFTPNHFRGFMKPQTSLFSNTDPTATDDETSSEHDNTPPLFDEKAFEEKNAYRRKFGLKPFTPEEFTKVQAEIQQFEIEQRQKQEQERAASRSSSSAEMTKSKEKSTIFNNLFGNIFEDTCEDNYDCERPEICCDLGFKKMCCSSGARIFDAVPPGGQLERIPIRVVADDGQFPRGGPDGTGGY